MAIKQNVTDLATTLTKGIDVDAKAGTATAAVDMYEKNLPEGVTMEQVTGIRDYNTTFVAASAKAFGELAVDALKSNKKLDSLAVDISMGGKDSVSHSILRSKLHIDRLHDNKETTKYGAMTTTFEVHGTKGSAGQLKAVRDEISELALKALAK